MPAPTPRAGVPELYAALTMPGPPVARMRSQIFISSLVPSMVGMEMQLTRSGDTLQLRSAPWMISTVLAMHLRALGCGVNTMALPDLSEMSDL